MIENITSFLFGKIYNGIRLTVVVVSGLTSIGLISYGAIMVKYPLIGLGSLGLAQTAFLAFDHSEVLQKIKKEINRLHSEIEQLTSSILKLSNELNRMTTENDKYSLLNSSFQERINYLNQNIDTISRELKDLESLNASLKENNLKLQDENNKLSENNKEFALNNQMLKQNNEKLTAQLKQLEQLHMDCKTLLLKLMQAGDAFKDFNNSLQGNVTQLTSTSGNLEQTANIMKVLIQGLSENNFSNMDENNDGKVSKEEFFDYLSKQKHATCEKCKK